MAKAIRIHQTGGPEVMKWEEVEVGRPGAGEVRVRNTAVGLNYIDVYHRAGVYPLSGFPLVLGREGAGVVEEVGEGVTAVKPGDRVGYVDPMGSYAQARLMPANRLVKLPEGISEKTAAAVMLKGITAQYLIRSTYPVQSGETILAHAAAGGVGLILCQWARHLGAIVIGTVGSEAKAELARANGCHHTIVYTKENFVERVKQITYGAGVPVAYDSVGKDTFEGSLDCLRPLGMLVSFGQASGKIPPFDVGILQAKGSLYLTRPTMVHYVAKDADLQQRAAEVFDAILKGAVKVEVKQEYPLKDAAHAHRDLEARRTSGSTVLIP